MTVLCRPEDMSVTTDLTRWQKRMNLPVFHSEDRLAAWSLSLSLCISLPCLFVFYTHTLLFSLPLSHTNGHKK